MLGYVINEHYHIRVFDFHGRELTYGTDYRLEPFEPEIRLRSYPGVTISGLQSGMRYRVEVIAYTTNVRFGTYETRENETSAARINVTVARYVAPTMQRAQLGLTTAQINWRVPAVTLNDEGRVASNGRVPTLAQQRTLDQRAATTHFQVAVIERIPGAGGNISAAQFHQWLNGTLPSNNTGNAIKARLDALRDSGELYRTLVHTKDVDGNEINWTGNNANENRVTAWNYSTTIDGLTAGKTYMVFVSAVSSNLGVHSVVARQQIKMPGSANTNLARLSPTLTMQNRSAAQHHDQPRLDSNTLTMSYRLANNIHAPLVNLAGATITLNIGIGQGVAPTPHVFVLNNNATATVDGMTLTVLKDELAFSNSRVGTGTLLLSGDGIRAGVGQVNVVLVGINGVTGADVFVNGKRNVRVTV
jgi:hypothetical protein